MIDKLSTEFAGRMRFAKLNIDDNPATANRFNVNSIPTLLIFKGGREVDRIVGLERLEGAGDRLHHGQRQGVESLRAIQNDEADRAVSLDEDFRRGQDSHQLRSTQTDFSDV